MRCGARDLFHSDGYVSLTGLNRGVEYWRRYGEHVVLVEFALEVGQVGILGHRGASVVVHLRELVALLHLLLGLDDHLAVLARHAHLARVDVLRYAHAHAHLLAGAVGGVDDARKEVLDAAASCHQAVVVALHSLLLSDWYFDDELAIGRQEAHELVALHIGGQVVGLLELAHRVVVVARLDALLAGHDELVVAYLGLDRRRRVAAAVDSHATLARHAPRSARRPVLVGGEEAARRVEPLEVATHRSVEVVERIEHVEGERARRASATRPHVVHIETISKHGSREVLVRN